LHNSKSIVGKTSTTLLDIFLILYKWINLNMKLNQVRYMD